MFIANLLNIRPLNGSQHYAFEELCCQLASLEPRQPGVSFIRKGPGADVVWSAFCVMLMPQKLAGKPSFLIDAALLKYRN